MDNKKLILEYESNGKSLLMGNDQAIKIVSIEGIESSDYLIHSASNATVDGVTITGKKVDQRIINVVFAIDDLENTELYRQQLIHFFNPKYPMRFKIDYCGVEAEIICEIESFKFTTQTSMWDYLEGNLSLLCPEPYFASLDNFGKNIAAMTRMFAFPFVIPPRGSIMSYRTLKQEVLLRNDGDVETGIEIHIIAERGTVKNPKITKISTEEFIEIPITMRKGDIITINTNLGKKTITYNGTNIFKTKNKLSTFFTIDVGDNLIRYDAEENYTNLDVKLFYTPKYLGV